MFTNNLIAGAAGQGGSFYPFPIDQSLRFNDNDSAYLSRTPASTTNRKTWTYSVWAKVAKQDSYGMLLEASDGSGNNEVTIGIDGLNKLVFYSYIGGYQLALLSSANLIRDPSAWYHFVFVADTTQATASERARVYINGVRLTSFSTETYPSQNYDTYMNLTQPHSIGRNRQVGRYFDGYIAEANFIDGQALDPTSFGETKSGVWVAKEYTGSYGTNGWHLDFANGASLGADTSGNSNNWTPINLVATDQVLDSPTNNFCTFNSVIRPYPNSDVLSEGNLRRTNSATGVTGSNWGTVNVTSGKWYYEVAIETAAALTCWIGWANDAIKAGGGTYTSAARDNAYMYMSNGNKALDSATGTAYGASYTTGDVIGVALDADNNTLTFYKNGVSQGVAFTGISTVGSWIPAVSSDPGWIPVTNFGQDSSFAGSKTAQGNTDANGVGDFYYAPPSGGYLALAASNLPDPAIDPAQDDVPSDYFGTVLYSGDGTTPRSITGLNFQPDFNWIKSRSAANHHQVSDAVRGATNVIYTSLTNAEAVKPEGLQSFDTNGFTVGNNGDYNQSGRTYVAWNWLAGNGTSSNTSGSITSTVSVNQKAGFSIVSYTGTGAAATVGHGLGAKPSIIFIKNRTTTFNWLCPTTVIDGSSDYLRLNNTEAKADWVVGGPNTTTFSIDGGTSVGSSGDDFIAYCWAEIPSYSSIGKYTGNGSSDGPFIFTGHAPAFIMYKRTDSTGNWRVMDNERLGYNGAVYRLYPNLSNAEVTGNELDILSNGFKLRNTAAEANASGGTYIYLSFASNPFKYANAR